MRYSTARDRFTAAARTGRCPYLTQSGSRKLSDDYRRKLLKHFDYAVRHRTHLDGDDLARVDIEPLLPDLEQAAEDGLRAAHLEHPERARCSVRQVVATLFPKRAKRRKRNKILPGFAPLFDAMTAAAAREKEEAERKGKINRGRASALRSDLYHIQELFVTNGVEGLDDIPSDFPEVRRWAREAGWSQNQWDTRIHAYRHARRLLPDPERIPGLYQRRRARDRGLRSLDLHAEMAKRGVETDPRRMTTLQIIRAFHPGWADGIELTLEWGQARNRSLCWQRGLCDAASRFMASLVRLGRDPGDVDLIDLWMPTATPTASRRLDPRIERVAAKYLRGAKPLAPNPCLAQVLVDEQAPAAWKASPRTVVQSAKSSTKVIPYVNTLVHDVGALWTITELLYRDVLNASQPGIWTSADRGHTSLIQNMRTHNKEIHTTGQLDKALIVDYGELVCRGLPWLRAYATAALDQMDAYAARPRHSRRQLMALATHAHAALQDYIILAVIIDDGLRVKNYAKGVVGANILVTYVLDEDGNPVGLERVETLWRGFDDPRVRLKRPLDARGGERRRRRTISRGSVDYDLMFRYLTWARPRDAVACGLIDNVEDFDPLQDGFAFYIRSRHLADREFQAEPTDDYDVRTGSVGQGQITTVVGRAIHDVMRVVLHEDIPDWHDPERTAEWRGIFSGHALRSAIADHYGYYLEDWDTASELTNTSVAVLKSTYASAIGDRKQRLARIGADNPTHFAQVIDAIGADWMGADWNRFWRSFDFRRPNQHLGLVMPPREGQDEGMLALVA